MDKRLREETLRIYEASAENYQNRFMQMDLYDDAYSKFCDLITKNNAKILDIACGPGNITKFLLQQRPDFSVVGIDIAPKMVTLAKQNNPNAEFKVLDCKDILELNQKFDAIICGFCMPYLSKSECKKLIEDCSKLLSKEGILYFSTMEDDYAKSGYEKTSFAGEEKLFIHYHEEKYLTKYLTENHFKILDVQRKNYPEIDGTFSVDMIFIVQKTKLQENAK